MIVHRVWFRASACALMGWATVAGCSPPPPESLPPSDATGSPRSDAEPKEDSPPVIVQLALGGQHSCARISDGHVACWGDDSTGQLGLGHRGQIARPAIVPDLAGVVDLAAGESHTCAVLRDGGVKCWGANSSGEIGNGRTDPMKSVLTPTTVVGLGDARSVRLGQMFSCALRKAGTVACWGSSASGALGDGTKTDHTRPADIPALRDVVELAVGSDTACARHADETVECWGRFVRSDVPKPMPNLTGAEEIAVASNSLCVRKHDGKITCEKEEAPAIDGVTRLVGGGFNGCAIDGGGALRCWGTNEFGQVGNGTISERVSTPAPIALDGVVEVAIGSMYHACARTKDGAVYCWGRNLYGALGDGTKQDRTTPTKVDQRYLAKP